MKKFELISFEICIILFIFQYQIMNIFTNTNGYDKQPSVAIACTLVMHGADLTIRNKKNQIPFDLCSDPHLRRILTQKNM